jgi:hypothetical protein
MADPLAAGALIMAILAALYGAWNADIAAALNLSIAPLKADRSEQRKQISRTLSQKALPLAIGAWGTLAVFVWRAGAIALTPFSPPKGAVFDDVGAAFILTQLFIAAMAVWRIHIPSATAGGRLRLVSGSQGSGAGCGCSVGPAR